MYRCLEELVWILLQEKLPKVLMKSYGQNWEYEAADARRVNEFILYYETAVLDQDEKFALMSLIIPSFNDAIRKAQDQDETWERIKKQLIRYMVLHRNTILYWSLVEEELEDCFYITPYMRQINLV